MSPERTESVDARLLGHVLRPYREHCRYLRSARVVVPEDGSCAVRIEGQLSIPDSCYIDDTGHFNSVEFNISYNQLVYALMAQCVVSDVLEVFREMTLEEYLERQLPDILIHDFRSKFRRALNPSEYRGTVEILDATRRRNFVLIHTRVEFSDGSGGDARGEVVLAIVDRASEAEPAEPQAPAAVATEAGFVADLQAAPEDARPGILTERLLGLLVEFLGFDADEQIGPDEGFLDLGFDSLLAVDFKVLLEQRFGLELSSTALFDCPTPRHLVELLLPRMVAVPETHAAGTGRDRADEGDDLLGLSRDELRRLAQLRGERLAALDSGGGAPASAEPIAIVGMACRFPGGANDPAAFWELQREGRDAIQEVPADRWDIDAVYDADPDAPGKMYTRWGGFIDDVSGFDAGFFGISPREALQLDPRARHLLEVAWETFENAAWSADELRGRPVGVFVGALTSEYLESLIDRDFERVDGYVATGNASSTLAGRVSYLLGLTGPCFALDTACSSSLVALHQAIAALRAGECESALVAGVNLLIDPIGNIAVCKASMLSPDGRCKTFDAAADGYVRAEGVAAIAIRPLSAALENGDRILALVRGTAINQDGASGGLTVPSSAAQQAVIRQALAAAGLEPSGVDYLEAHGTGTALGDPIEISAIDAVFGPEVERGRPLAIGSVKTNVGHTEPVAGLAGLIKVVQALRHSELPAHLNLQQPSPHIPWETSVTEVVLERRSWLANGRPRRAGINSFGFSGTNGHALIEEAPAVSEAETAARPCEPVRLSADSPAALARLAERLLQQRRAEPDVPLRDLAHTLNTGRAARSLRAGAVVATHADYDAFLEAVAAGPGERGRRAPARPPRVAFLFTGQASQWAGMGRDLHRDEPVFRRSLERTAGLLDPHLEAPLLEVLWGARTELLERTDFTQPALFALQVALVETWRAYGLRPDLLLGHSVGEIAAAWTAGVFSLEHAARLVLARGRLMVEHTAPGAMLEVLTEARELDALIDKSGGKLGLAAVNCEARVVLSGAPEHIAAAQQQLDAEGRRSRALSVSHAFHSPLMEPMLPALKSVLAEIEFKAPRLEWVSCLDPLGPMDAWTDPEYWLRHVREPVRFHAGMLRLVEHAPDVLLEIGPNPVLLGLARRFVDDPQLAFVPSQRAGQGGFQQLAEAALELHARGAALDWRAVDAGSGGRSIELPSYPFEHERYWLEPARRRSADPDAHPLLGAGRSVAALGAETRLFEATYEPTHPVLADHRVQGSVVVAGAAWIECALTAARSLHPTGPLELHEFEIAAAHFVPTAGSEIQLSCGQDGEFSIHGRDRGAEAWVRHAGGRWATANARGSRSLDLEQLQAEASETVDVETHRASLQDVGLEYGPFFARTAGLARGDELVVARLNAPEPQHEGPFVLHPGLLDAAFQCAGLLAQGPDAGADLHLPVGLGSLRLNDESARPTRVCARLAERAADGSFTAIDLDLADESGRVLVELRGLRLVRTAREALLAQTDPLRALAHEVRWSSIPVPEPERAALEGDWLWIGTADRELERAFAEHGARLVCTGAQASPEEIGAQAARLAAPRGILLAESGSESDAFESTRSALVRLRAAARAALAQLERGDAAPRIGILTRGAFSVSADGHPGDPAQAALHGFAGSAVLEHPELAWATFDREPRCAEPAQEATAIVAGLACAGRPGAERRLAWRGGQLRAARLVPAHLRAPAALELPERDSYRLRVARFGELDSLCSLAQTRRAPGPDEVELGVRHVALNFKDVLLAMGQLRPFTGIERASEQPLGHECEGVVLRVGEGVDAVQPGDRVSAVAPGCLASHVIVRQGQLVRMPSEFTRAQAAATPIAGLTALHALEGLARLQPGERVLIHGAAGGTGQAAIALAQAIGAEIHATASAHKWPLLRAQGIEHLYPSREATYATDVLAATDGEGVDVVLDGAAGAHVAEGLRCLRHGGRFIELGKLETWTPEQIAAERPDVEYASFELYEVLSGDARAARALVRRFEQRLAEDGLRPPTVQSFHALDAPAVLRLLAQSRHVGKLVLELPVPRAERPAAVRGDGCYLITGGLGALGRHTARELVRLGARHLVCLGRNPDSETATRLVRELEAEGARVQVAAVDVSDRAALGELIAGLEQPLRGVFHAAGVLRDGVLGAQADEDVDAVLAPKVRGAQALHELCCGPELEQFVLYSSMASLVGNPGQTAYAAGNAFLDGLAARRRARGLPGVSIAWGAWSGEGMAAGLDERAAARLAARGMGAITPELGRRALRSVLHSAPPGGVVGILPVTWSRYFAAADSIPRYLEVLAGGAPIEAQRDERLERLRAAIDAGAEAQAIEPVMLEWTRGVLARSLGHASPDAVDPERALTELGVDSLMGVELRHRLESGLSISVPVSLVFDHPSLTAIAAHLSVQVAEAGGDDVDALLAEIEELGEEQARELLDGSAQDPRDDRPGVTPTARP